MTPICILRAKTGRQSVVLFEPIWNVLKIPVIGDSEFPLPWIPECVYPWMTGKALSTDLGVTHKF